MSGSLQEAASSTPGFPPVADSPSGDTAQHPSRDPSAGLQHLLLSTLNSFFQQQYIQQTVNQRTIHDLANAAHDTWEKAVNLRDDGLLDAD